MEITKIFDYKYLTKAHLKGFDHYKVIDSISFDSNVQVPAILEPVGLARDDGMTLVPWRMGRPLVWDATCVDTLAPSHLPGTSKNAGNAASTAEDLKRRKYATLGSAYIFDSFGVDTLGPWGPSARRIYKDLAARLTETTGDQTACQYFAQRFSIAIQRGNAASLLGTLPIGTDLEDIFIYSAIDTSPLSKYVMHPFWNTVVKFIPRWIAPNLLTFVGFLCMVASVALLTFYDYAFVASGAPPGYQKVAGDGVPQHVFTACGVLLFLAYNLDGIDGKQARRIGASGPLGEMFDHGLDSYIVFFIPFTLMSVMGRGEYSVSAFRGYLAVASVVLNFYVSHWEKYNTGTLYLPWGYDLSMWVSSIFFLVAGARGAEVYQFTIFEGVTFTQGLEVAIHATGLFTTLPIAVYNVYLSYQNGSGKMYPLLEMLRPAWSILTLAAAMTVWAVKSPLDVMEYDPRAFLLLFGTLFSNIASRLIVAEMSDQRCDLITWLLWPLLVGVSSCLWLPGLELPLLYFLLPLSILAHVHYGVCVVRQMCQHFGVSCFTVPRVKTKMQKRKKRNSS